MTEYIKTDNIIKTILYYYDLAEHRVLCGPCSCSDKISYHFAGLTLAFSRNRFSGSYLVLSATSRS